MEQERIQLPAWQAAFGQAWEGYKRGCTPIGAAIVNANGEIVSVGRNRIREKEGKMMEVFHHQIAHAELNAILQLSEYEGYEDIRTYCLYVTMEPCPGCFGAIIMGSIRNVKFATHDPWAGATQINELLPYAKMKQIRVEGPFEALEIVQTALWACYELERLQEAKYNAVLERFQTYCPIGLLAAQKLQKEKSLQALAAKDAPVEEMLACVSNVISSIQK